MTLPVAFFTDYGYEDAYAGSCKLVIERFAPGTIVVDLTHGIPLADVRRGALVLASAVVAAPPTVYLGVVDPGVGTDRRGVAIGTADGSFFVGPDNGLFGLAADELGGTSSAWDISSTSLRLEPVSPTFHGRDVFAPVAAHLAAGRPVEAVGEEIDRGTLVTLDLPEARREGDALVTPVLYADGFGNLILSATEADLGVDAAAILVTGPDGEHEAVRASFFAEGEGGLVLYRSSQGRLALGLDRGSAADLLGAERDDEIRIAPAS